MTVALSKFWLIRSNYGEASYWLEDALSQPEARGSQATTRLRPQLLNLAGEVRLWQGDFASARARLAECIELCRASLDYQNLGRALAISSHIIMNDPGSQEVHPLSEALALASESVEVSYIGRDTWGIAMALFALGRAERGLNYLERAREHYEQSLALCVEVGDMWSAAFPLSHLGFVAYRQGDYAAARRSFVQRLDIGRKFQSKQFEWFSLYMLGTIAFESGEYEEALDFLKQSLLVTTEPSQGHDALFALFDLARVYAAKGQLHKATRLAAAAESHWLAHGIELGQENQAENDEFTRTLAEKIDADVLATLWSEGRALSLEQAIELAISDGDA